MASRGREAHRDEQRALDTKTLEVIYNVILLANQYQQQPAVTGNVAFFSVTPSPKNALHGWDALHKELREQAFRIYFNAVTYNTYRLPPCTPLTAAQDLNYVIRFAMARMKHNWFPWAKKTDNSRSYEAWGRLLEILGIDIKKADVDTVFLFTDPIQPTEDLKWSKFPDNHLKGAWQFSPVLFSGNVADADRSYGRVREAIYKSALDEVIDIVRREFCDRYTPSLTKADTISSKRREFHQNVLETLGRLADPSETFRTYIRPGGIAVSWDIRESVFLALLGATIAPAEITAWEQSKQHADKRDALRATLLHPAFVNFSELTHLIKSLNTHFDAIYAPLSSKERPQGPQNNEAFGKNRSIELLTSSGVADMPAEVRPAALHGTPIHFAGRAGQPLSRPGIKPVHDQRTIMAINTAITTNLAGLSGSNSDDKNVKGEHRRIVTLTEALKNASDKEVLRIIIPWCLGKPMTQPQVVHLEGDEVVNLVAERLVWLSQNIYKRVISQRADCDALCDRFDTLAELLLKTLHTQATAAANPHVGTPRGGVGTPRKDATSIFAERLTACCCSATSAVAQYDPNFVEALKAVVLACDNMPAVVDAPMPRMGGSEHSDDEGDSSDIAEATAPIRRRAGAAADDDDDDDDDKAPDEAARHRDPARK